MDNSIAKFKSVKLFVFWTCVYCSVTVKHSMQHYTSTSGPLTHILLDDTGQVFVSGENVLLKFTHDLVLKESISTRRTSNCSEDICENTFDNNSVSILMLHPYQHETYVLFCGTIDYGSCSLFNRSDLKNIIPLKYWDPEASAHFLGSQTSALAIVIPVVSYGRSVTHIFSAMDYDGRDKKMFPKVFSVRILDEMYQEIIYAYSTDTTDYITLKDELFNKSLFDFKYGFHFDGYAYFLRNVKAKSAHAQISEVCSQDKHYRSYVESELSCDGYTLIESAYLLENDGDIATLYVAFTSSKYQGSVLCEYSMDELRQAFRRIQSDCFYRGVGSAPDWIAGNQVACVEKQPSSTDFSCGKQHINPRIKSVSPIEMHRLGWDDGIMTAIVAATENGTTAFYCGFKDGTLQKFLVVNTDLMTLYSIEVTNGSKVNDNMVIDLVIPVFLKLKTHLMTLYSIKMTHGSKVNDKMAIDPINRHLYLTYSDTVSMLRTDSCFLHSSCVDCLSDTMPCQWCFDSTPGGHCIATNTTCNNSRTTYCEAEIQTANPLSGPIAGGTLLTLDGIFGDPSVSVYRITVGQECILNNASNNRITCVTSLVASPTDDDIELNVTYSGNSDKSRPVPIYGRTKFGSKYLYRDPKIATVAPTRVSNIGRPIMVITGEHLDIGASPHCEVGGSVCDILSTEQTELVVGLNNESRTTGTTTLNYNIDHANVSANIEIIEPPVIESITPNSSIQSGGITLTVAGVRLDGMGKFLQTSFLCNGMSCEDNTTKGASDCQIHNETTMSCRSPPVQTDKYPALVEFGVQNRFGPIYLTDSNDLDILKDPEISNFTETLFISSERTPIIIHGRGFKRVEAHEIEVRVGPVSCPVSDVSDVDISCLFEIPADLGFHNEVIQVRIGNIIRSVGYAVYHKPGRQQAPKYSIASGTDIGIVIIAIIGGIVLLTVLVTLGMKRLRLGPFKRQTEEQFDVVFRNGGSDVLTLDGLSENHATDISQNRQNAYQEQTFRKPVLADDNYETCTEPLLPVVDENIKLTLERQQLLIDRDYIVLGESIGQGHFGCVYKGYLQTPGEKGEQIVAAKTLHRKNPKDLDINMFLKEALIMKDFQHRHVMKLIGICIGHDELPLVILPYMENGDLLTYLRDPKNVPTVKELVAFGVDVANGMCYLAELKFVHRDLAARNCMMGDDYRVKVADFGLSRDVYEKEYYSSCDKTTKLPVKWMAPESLEFGMYSSKSDVWSYGVVLWELLTRGMNPYPEVDNWDILRYLKMERRMSQPSFCPEEMFSIMQRCWSWEPADRPSFGELTVEIPAMIRQLEHPAGERGNRINIETTYVNFRNN